MFSGIIQEVGKITEMETSGDWVVTIDAPETTQSLAVGASVACNGVCLTIIEIKDTGFVVQLSGETLSKTSLRDWLIGSEVNLERALRLGDELSGHMVLGHVDGLAKVVSRSEELDSIRFVFKVPETFKQYLAPKGSIALDGISLTINDVNDSFFGVNIIPHTQKVTTIGLKQAGDLVNFEVDVIARYVGRMLATRGV